jgi:hypothetical protein
MVGFSCVRIAYCLAADDDVGESESQQVSAIACEASGSSNAACRFLVLCCCCCCVGSGRRFSREQLLQLSAQVLKLDLAILLRLAATAAQQICARLMCTALIAVDVAAAAAAVQ